MAAAAGTLSFLFLKKESNDLYKDNHLLSSVIMNTTTEGLISTFPDTWNDAVVAADKRIQNFTEP
jgi:hypothetical protein